MIKDHRVGRQKTIRKRIIGTGSKPRLSVFRSSQHIYAQIIDDSNSKTLVAVADIKETGTKKEKAYKLGKDLAQKALKKKITEVIFDRGGFLYHGRIAEIAKGAREGGLKF